MAVNLMEGWNLLAGMFHVFDLEQVYQAFALGSVLGSLDYTCM